MEPTREFSVRVKRGPTEVEVRGSEEFVREMADKLIHRHLGDSDYEVLPRDEATPLQNGNVARYIPATTAQGTTALALPPGLATFRDMLNEVPGSTVADKVVMAGYLVMAEGNEAFDASSLARHFDSAYERQPNFSRELEKAARAGWLMKAGVADGRRNLFKLTHRGIQRVQELLRQREAV